MAVGALLPQVRWVAMKDGAVAPGALLYTYLSGTSTPQSVWTTSALNVARTNPVEAGADGMFPIMYLSPVAYRIRLTDADGNEIIPLTDNVYDFGEVQIGTAGASTGSALVGFLQAGAGAVNRTAQAKLRETLSVTDFGAVGDGSTDDYAAITAAMAACSATGGGVVAFPTGHYVVSQTLIVPDRVRLVGTSPQVSACRIGTKSPFTGTILVDLGDNLSALFGVRLENLFIDASDVASTGVRMRQPNERCGIFNCVIEAFNDTGVDISGGAGAICELSNVEVYGPNNVTGHGIVYDQNDGILILRHITLGATVGNTGNGVDMRQGTLYADGIHVEKFQDGIELGRTDVDVQAYIAAITGDANMTNLIHITGADRGATICAAYANGCTNTIKDDVLGRTIDSASFPYVPFYSLGAVTGGRVVVSGLSGTAGGWQASRLAGISGVMNRELTTDIKVHRELSGSRGLVDSGTAAPGDLFTLTVSSTASEDDAISAICSYHVKTTTAATASVETGQVSVAMTRDSSGNIVVATPAKFGNVQALDAGMATLTVTFDTALVGSVLTVRCTAETSADVPSNIFFTVRVLGGTRSASTAALAAGVTAAT